MFEKVKNAIQNPSKKTKVAATIVTSVSTMAAFMPMAMAEGSVSVKDIVSKLLGIIVNIFFYIGILLLAWSVGMLVLAFKQEDPDSKSRAMMLLIVSACLIGIKPFLEAVLSGTGVSITDQAI